MIPSSYFTQESHKSNTYFLKIISNPIRRQHETIFFTRCKIQDQKFHQPFILTLSYLSLIKHRSRPMSNYLHDIRSTVSRFNAATQSNPKTNVRIKISLGSLDAISNSSSLDHPGFNEVFPRFLDRYARVPDTDR